IARRTRSRSSSGGTSLLLRLSAVTARDAGSEGTMELLGVSCADGTCCWGFSGEFCCGSCATAPALKTKSARAAIHVRCPTLTLIFLSPLSSLVVAVQSSIRQSLFVNRLSLSRHRHPFDPQCRTRQRSTKFQIVSNFRDVVQHVFQIPCHRDLLERVGKLTVLDPHATRATREIASHQVHAESQELRHQQSLLDVANNLLRRTRSRL